MDRLAVAVKMARSGQGERGRVCVWGGGKGWAGERACAAWGRQAEAAGRACPPRLCPTPVTLSLTDPLSRSPRAGMLAFLALRIQLVTPVEMEQVT